jgi:DNA-binding response OmpR family regulator
MTAAEKPIILLITDDPAEESHSSHILAKYHFDNFLVKLRRPGDAIKYFLACNTPDHAGAESLPEMIILGLREAGRLHLAPVVESRRGNLIAVPLVVLVESREEEDEVRRLQLPNTACVSRPIGFFKLLEAMQKLEMRWIVLKPK